VDLLTEDFLKEGISKKRNKIFGIDFGIDIDGVTLRGMRPT